MKTFRQFLREGRVKLIRLQRMPKPNNKEIWDRLREDEPLTGWLFPNGAMHFNPFTGHVAAIEQYFKMENGIGAYIEREVQRQGLAIHIEDDAYHKIIRIDGTKENESFIRKWIREMGIKDERDSVIINKYL